METVLDSEYQPAERPYSKAELTDTQRGFYQKARLGEVRAQHEKCGHFYLTRKGGRKEEEILKNNNPDSGNCSVCWKIQRTPNQLRSRAISLTNKFWNTFYEEDDNPLTYENLDLETSFYTWLYLEK